MAEKHTGPAFVPFQVYAERGEQLHTDNERLRELATTDQLSGALNRHGLEMYLESAEMPKALLLVDATNFKAVNEIYGYNAGDQLIIDTYDILQKSTRPNDVIARWGGDEFTIVLNGEEKDPADTDFPENRRTNTAHVKYIDSVKERIAVEVKAFLKEHPDLESVNFDLAVGGTAWFGKVNIQDLIAHLEEELKLHKEIQHQKGQFRNI